MGIGSWWSSSPHNACWLAGSLAPGTGSLSCTPRTSSPVLSLSLSHLAHSHDPPPPRPAWPLRLRTPHAGHYTPIFSRRQTAAKCGLDGARKRVARPALPRRVSVCAAFALESARLSGVCARKAGPLPFSRAVVEESTHARASERGGRGGGRTRERRNKPHKHT